jgi:hypothetical protein
MQGVDSQADVRMALMKSWLLVLACVFSLIGAGVPQSSAADEPAIVVGRVSYIEGDLLRYVPEEDDWVAVVTDAPFGTEDALYSGSRGMAELIAPNGTWIRIRNGTQLQFIALEADLSEVDVGLGTARFSNRSSAGLIKATSPFGYVLADPGTVFDFIVGDDSVEVVALKGRVSFFHAAMEAKFDVTAGFPSILADRTQVSSGAGTVDPGWDRWNRDRDDFWAAKARKGGLSAEYLPPDLRDEAYTLEENGRWEMVPYEGAERLFWQPTAVDAGWSPFTMGRWTDWYGDQTWIPAEPFGYITHHYGNWIYTRNHWYWAPPAAGARVGLPLLNVGFRWYPGRVCWIHAGSSIGWVPLAPHETYYCRHRWGGAYTTVVSRGNITQINVNIRNYVHLGHAVVVNRSNFFKVNNYRPVRLTNVSRATIINTYRAAPLVGNSVIRNYSTNRQRYTYTNRKVTEKPHPRAMDRIQHNRAIIQQGRGERSAAVKERVKVIPEGKVDHGARIDRPKVSNAVVPAGGVKRPKTEVRFPPAAQPERLTSKGPVQQPVPPGPRGMPSAKPERAAPERKPQPEQPGRFEKRPEPVLPTHPSRPAPPSQPTKPAAVLPAMPVPPAQPATQLEQGERARRGPQVRPPQPVQPIPPAARPERVLPVQPSQPAQTVPVHPVQPAQPVQQPAAQPEGAAPARPGQPEQPGQPAGPGGRPGRGGR